MLTDSVAVLDVWQNWGLEIVLLNCGVRTMFPQS